MKLKKKLLTLAVIMSVLLPNTARTAEDACTPVVNACDKALATQDRVIELGRKVELTQTSIIDAQDKQIQELSKRESSLLSSPWLWLSVGLVVGAYAAGRAK